MLSNFGSSVRYLEFYHQFARPVLSSGFDAEFWSRITIQLAFAEPSVRHALIALGYLQSTETGTLRDARAKYGGHSESGTLMYHYNKSVRYLIERMNEVTYTPEVGLVTCLLFVCIEFLRGNYHTAFTHLTKGLKLVSEQPGHSRPASSCSSLSVTSHPSATSNIHSSTLVNDELRPIFIRSMAAAMMYGVNVDASIDIPPPSLDSYRNLRFESVREAQLHSYELRNQSTLVIRDLSRKILAQQTLTVDDLARHSYMLDCQRAWLQALHMFRKGRHLSSADELAISVLIMHYHTSHIWTTYVADVDQMAVDKHIEDFQDILRHGKLVLDSMDLAATRPAANFTFEICLIPALYFVGLRCRCPRTRREAVTLLERSKRREGMWDVEQHVLVLKRVIEMEEEEVDPVTGWPVARVRLWSSVIESHMGATGGFWANFLPSGWVGQKTPDGKQRVLRQYFGP